MRAFAKGYADRHRPGSHHEGDDARELARRKDPEHEQNGEAAQDDSRSRPSGQPRQGDGEVEGQDVSGSERRSEGSGAPVDGQSLLVPEGGEVRGQEPGHAQDLEGLQHGNDGHDCSGGQ